MNIIEKAKQLGLDIGNGSTNAENLSYIASQVGAHDLESLNEKLDSMLSESNNIETLDDGIESLETMSDEISEEQPQRRERIGDKQYNEAKNEHGVYDNKYYANKQKKLDDDVKKAKEEKNNSQKEVTKKNEQGEKNTVQKNKNIFDKTKDNINYAKARKEQMLNPINDKLAKIGRARNLIEDPLGEVKDKAKAAAKDAAKDVGKKAGKAAANAGKAAGKAAVSGLKAVGSFLLKNPYVLMAIGIIALILLLVIIILLMFGGSTTPENGYFDPACNFEGTYINVVCVKKVTTKDEEGNEETKTVREVIQELTLKNYTLGVMHDLGYNLDMDDDNVKAMMIVTKTNMLSNGYYSNQNKLIEIESCDPLTSIDSIGEKELTELNEIYDEINGELYLPESYEGTITNLEPTTSLEFDSEEFLNARGSYTKILKKMYKDSDEKLKMYYLVDNCTFYELTETSEYWWPIGSAEPTSGNIYGGEPTSTNVTSKYGMRMHPVYNELRHHTGIDIGGGCNQVVIAAKSGTVKRAIVNGGYGNFVEIDHGEGITTRYAHLSQYNVVVGQAVNVGEKIGLVGNTGTSTGCHLHFEVLVNGSDVNPLNYVSQTNTRPTTSTGGKAEVCKALLNNGFSEEATAGLMVNIYHESRFKTNIVEYSSGYTLEEVENIPATEAAGFGLFQWSYGRRIEMINFAKARGMSITSLTAQLQFFIYELENKSSYSTSKEYLYGDYTANEIAKQFCLNFERPSNLYIRCPQRANDESANMLIYVQNGCK